MDGGWKGETRTDLVVALEEVVEGDRVEGAAQALHDVDLELKLFEMLGYRALASLVSEVPRDLLQELGHRLHRDALLRDEIDRLAHDAEASGADHLAELVALAHVVAPRVPERVRAARVRGGMDVSARRVRARVGARPLTTPRDG